MPEKNNVISFSGGKDSTAMLLMMLERGEPIHSVVFFDTGWEFPEMLEHIDFVEKRTGIEIVRLKPSTPFDYWLCEKPIISRKGLNEGRIYRHGQGWPNKFRRWCTRDKIDALDRYCNSIANPIACIGLSADETHRQKPYEANKINARYPLIEWGISGKGALAYCWNSGYSWDGLYEHFSRVSCFCCPMQRIGELRTLRKYYPELWARMLDMDSRISHNRGFRGYDTVHDLDHRFADDDRQMMLPLLEADK